MDLGRWNFRHLGRFLGDVLDGDLEAFNIEGTTGAATDSVRDAFEVNESNDDLDRALALVRPGASPEKLLNAFAPFFEGGICLKVVDGETRLTNLFLFGETFNPPEPEGTPVFLGLRAMSLSQVYKASLGPILKALGLSSFFRLEGASAFAFALSRDTIFILFDNRPHPWQVFAIENAFFSARETFARLKSSRPAAASSRGFFK